MATAENDEQFSERGDPVTARTALAIAAEHEAFKAQMGVLAVKRTLRNTRLVWGGLGLISTLVLAGFTFRGRIDQFVTKDKLDVLEARQTEGERRMDRALESLSSIKEMVTRMANQNDRIFDRLLPREREREHGR